MCAVRCVLCVWDFFHYCYSCLQNEFKYIFVSNNQFFAPISEIYREKDGKMVWIYEFDENLNWLIFQFAKKKRLTSF